MKSSTVRHVARAAAICLAIVTVACGKDTRSAGNGASAVAEPKPAAPAATGRVIVVEAYSDANGNYFKPAEVVAKKGDIVRFTLKMGVHNVDFLPDSNSGKAGLPKASDMLQLPDQTFDFIVNLEKGKYYFQCDPHAALGMKGHLTVED